MRRIKRRTRADRLGTEQRSGRRRIGRWIYLALLVALGLWLLDFLVGDYFYLEARGLVTRPSQSVGSPNIATVERVLVDKGDRVDAGETMLRISSQQALQEIANLSTRLAEVEVRREELASRRGELEALRPIARERAEAIERLRARREQAIEEGLDSERDLHDLIEAEYDAVAARTKMGAEARTIDKEQQQLRRIADRLDNVLERMEAAYNGGRVDAPVAGRVAGLDTTAGSVVRPGEPLLKILHGESYVLGYVESGALFRLEEGQEVLVRNGVDTFRGHVTDILPISEQLPPEFQRAFEPAKRSQVIRVALATDDPPPTYSRVAIVAANSWLRMPLRWLPD